MASQWSNTLNTAVGSSARRHSHCWIGLAVVTVLGKDEHRVHFLTELPHEPSIVDIELDVVFVSG